MGYVGQAPGSGGVTSSDIVDLAIVNADVNASAALAFSKLAALSDGNILVGSSGNVPTSVNPSGDVDVSNAGVFSIASDSVINADIKSDAAIASSKLATVAVAQGGTGATTLNDLITLATHTQGDYVQNITAGTGLTSSGATSGENIAHSLSVDAAQSHMTTVGTVTTGTWSTGAVIAGATMTLGSDATGDTYYRNASGVLTRLAKGSDDEVLTLASGLPSWASGGGGVDVQAFTSSGTWTKPAGATFVMVEILGAGGGGGSGRRGSAGSQRNGGFGAGGGGKIHRTFLASDLGSTVTVTIGAGGAGAGVEVDDNNDGNGGVEGGDTSFGSDLAAPGGTNGRSGGSYPYFGNAAGGFHPPTANGSNMGAIYGGQGASQSQYASMPLSAAYIGESAPASGGGGGGCALNASNANIGPGAGAAPSNLFTSSSQVSSMTLIIDGAVGTNGTNATAGGAATVKGGGGGGGGSSTAGNAGAAGGAGLAPGGGGAGGGASLNGANSGAGGAGGAGYATVTSW